MDSTFFIHQNMFVSNNVLERKKYSDLLTSIFFNKPIQTCTFVSTYGVAV